MTKYKITHKLAVLFVMVIFAICPANASDFNCVFEHYSTHDGLSHGSISTMLKDNRGFMWFATWDGLNRYDGFNFKVYKQSSNIASNRILTLTDDTYDNIWFISYDLKCFRLNYKTEKIEPICYPQTDSIVQNISSFFLSSIGDVWISTQQNGLFRVLTDEPTNKITIAHYHSGTELEIPGNTVSSVFEDSNKNIWIETENGLSLLTYNPGKKEFTKEQFKPNCKSLLLKADTRPLINYKNTVLLGTGNGGLISYNPASEYCSEIDIKNTSPITIIVSDRKENIYIGTNGNGVIEYNLLKNEITNHFIQPEMNVVYRMYVDEKNLLWVESSHAGMSYINLRTSEYRHFVQKMNVIPDVRNQAQCGLIEEEKYIWLTLKGGGFGYYNYTTDKFNYFFNNPDSPNSKLSNFVNGFYKDKSNVLWISTYFKGLEKVTIVKSPIEHRQLVPQNKFSIANEVRAMFFDSKNQLWIATKNQEVFILDESFNIKQKIDSYRGNSMGRVYAITEDSKGNIFLGTKGKGLYMLSLQNNGLYIFKHFAHHKTDCLSLSNNNLYSLVEDNNGRIWIGTYGGGVNIFDGNNFIHKYNLLKNYPELGALKVRHISKDQKGNIWAGTTEGILFINTSNDSLNIQWFTNSRANTEGLSGTDIFWIYPDSKGQIWCSSLGGGLAKLQNYPTKNCILKFKTLTKKDGLPSNVIFTITEDLNGNLWMSSENGIVKYNEEKNSFNSYNKFDGITNPVFSEASVATHPNGDISFGANNGYYSFTPSSFNTAPEKLNLLFTEFKLFNSEVAPGEKSPLVQSITISDKIRLKYNQNFFTLTWSSLNYYLQNSLQYQYRLDGYETYWNRITGEGKASYSKVPPGKYTFIVQVANEEFHQLNPSKEIQIVIAPPIWKSKLAYVIYFILILIILYISRNLAITIIKLRNKVIIEKEITEIKLNFFTKISHELRTPLTLITGPAKELTTNENLSEKGIKMALLIEHNAQRLLKIVNQLLDFRRIQSKKLQLNLKEIELNTFLEQIIQNFRELANDKKISLQFISGDTSITCPIDEEKMESVITNLLSNAFKFTPEYGYISIYLDKEKNGNKLFIKIEDNGQGIPKSKEKSLFEIFSSYHSPEQQNYTGSGIGLALSKEFVKLHEGDLYYQPTPGGGATFIVQLNKEIRKHETQTYFESEINKQDTALSGNHEDDKNKAYQKLLIVEDNQELRDFLHLQLAGYYKISEAENGKEGFQEIIAHQPDIILSDIMMPEMDGIELLDKIKNNFETSHIPVVLLTAKSSVESKVEGLKYGADAYITKPFHIDEVIAQLNNLLQQRRRLRDIFTQLSPSNHQIENIQVTDADTKFLQRVREIVKENVGNPNFKMEILYRESGMGRTKFYDKLKGLTGLSPVDFVKEFRLNFAFNLLQSGKYNVSEASDMSGFSDSGYFSKRFKEHFGNSPSAFMKKG